MVDEIREIQIKWVGDASALISDIDTSRSEIEQFKTILRSLGADSEESLAVVEASFKRTFGAETLDPLRAKIKALKAELAAFGSATFKDGSPIPGLGEATADITEPMWEELAKDQELLKRLTDDVRIAISELRKEFIQYAEVAQKSFASAGEATDKFRNKVDEAKVEIQKLLAEGKQLSDIKVGLAETGRYEPKQLAQANKEVAESIKAQKNAYDNLEKSINEAASAAKAAAEKTVAANKSAIVSTDEWRAKVNAAKKELQDVTSTGRSLDDAFRGVGDTGRHEGTALTQAMREVKVETGEVKKGFSQLGNVANRVFRSIVGFIVLNYLRQLLQVFSELIESGRELATTIVDVAIATRQLQRAGVEITQLEVREFVQDLRTEFGLFSTQELNDGIASLFILGEQLGLTKDEMFEFAHAMAVASTVSGVDFSEGMERGLRALSTGQTRGLVEMRLAISELMVKEEAYRLGLVERGEAVDKVAKQEAMLSLIIQQASELEEDAAQKQETTVGQLEKSEQAIETLKASLGTRLLPLKQKWLFLIEGLLTGLNQMYTAVGRLDNFLRVNLSATFFTLIEITKSWWDALRGKGSAMSMDEIVDKFRELQQAARDAIAAQEAPGDTTIGEKGEESARQVDEAADDIIEAYDDLFIKLRESIIDGNQAVEKENTNFFRKLLEDAQKYALKVKQLGDKLAFDRAKVERDFQNKVSDINTEARKKEIDAEEKYQDRLRELRRKFMLDLEDALQERDAKQILRLIRDYNSRKNELGRQREGERKDLEQDRQDELDDLRKQRDRRLEELDLEYKFRRAKMQEEFDLELKLDWERHNQKLDDLKKQTDERNDEILRRFKDEWDITDEWAKAISDRLNQEFGPDGRVSQIYDYMIAYATQAAQAIAQAHMQSYRYGGGGFTGDVGQEPTGNLKIEPPNSYFPRQPAIAPPNTYFPRPPSGINSISTSGESLTQIEVILSPDLEARVINQTKSDIADVFIRASK